MMKNFIYLILLFPMFCFAQRPIVAKDTTTYDYYYIEGDSIPKTQIDLDEVILLHKLEFTSKE